MPWLSGLAVPALSLAAVALFNCTRAAKPAPPETRNDSPDPPLQAGCYLGRRPGPGTAQGVGTVAKAEVSAAVRETYLKVWHC